MKHHLEALEECISLMVYKHHSLDWREKQAIMDTLVAVAEEIKGAPIKMDDCPPNPDDKKQEILVPEPYSKKTNAYTIGD